MKRQSSDSHVLKEDYVIKEKDDELIKDDLDIQIVNELASIQDDPSLPCFTLRALVVGIVLACLGSSVYQLMTFKPVGLPLTNTFMLMLAYVFCHAWTRWVPPHPWFNPGPFNLKEHACIYVLVSSANASAYATYILSAQDLYYNHAPGPAGAIFLLMATQMVGYGIAGQLKTFLVDPPHMIWPTSLPTVSLLVTLNQQASRWRTRFFFLVFAGVFFYEFIPQYMMPILGGVSVACLANTNAVWIQRLFGGLAVNEGLGILSLSFDWNYLSNLSPLVLPLYVQLNIYIGIVLLWIIAPLLYHFNVWHAQSFPFLSNSIFQLLANGTSVIYPQHQVLNPDNSLNQTALEQIGRPHFSAVAAFGYVMMNVGVTASITHIGLFHGKDIYQSVKQGLSRFGWYQHCRGKVAEKGPSLDTVYPQVPTWWYYVVYISGIGLNILVAYVNQSQLPWYGVLIAIFMSTFLSLPLNMITAITGTGFGLNVFAEMIGGFIFPGLPVANMYFKTLGYNTLHQAGVMATDLKIGQYLNIPPRAIFLNQFLGTSIGCIFNYIVNHSIIQTQRQVLLDPIGNNIWNGASPQTVNAAAITWGAIGPMHMFGPGTDYYIILWGFMIGFIVPLPFWLLHQYYPSLGFNYVNIPMVLVGLTIVPGSATSWITVSFIITVVSQYYIKRRYRALFIKYNYLVSTALDSGTSLMVFMIAMFLYGGATGTSIPFPTWWGNRADLKYMDHCCATC